VPGGACGVVLEGGTLTSSAGPRRGLPVLHAPGCAWTGVRMSGIGS